MLGSLLCFFFLLLNPSLGQRVANKKKKYDGSPNLRSTKTINEGFNSSGSNQWNRELWRKNKCPHGGVGDTYFYQAEMIIGSLKAFCSKAEEAKIAQTLERYIDQAFRRIGIVKSSKIIVCKDPIPISRRRLMEHEEETSMYNLTGNNGTLLLDGADKGGPLLAALNIKGTEEQQLHRKLWGKFFYIGE